MGNFRKNKKTAGKARGTIDKAQNNLLMSLKKDVDELKSDVETKYSMYVSQDICSSYDGSSAAGRAAQIIKVEVGEVQGLTDQGRIGDKISLKHINMTYQVNLPNPRPSEFQPSQSTVRVLMFWDNQPNTISAAGNTQTNIAYWPQIMQLAPTPGVASNDIDKRKMMISLKDWDNRKRYNIIYDKTHTLAPTYNGAAPVGTAPTNFQETGLGSRCTTGVVSFSKSYKSQKILYTSAGTIPNNRQLYYAYLSDVPNTQNNAPNLSAVRPVLTTAIRCLYDDA